MYGKNQAYCLDMFIHYTDSDETAIEEVLDYYRDNTCLTFTKTGLTSGYTGVLFEAASDG